MSSSHSSPSQLLKTSLARQACIKCHAQKRKCSRHVPQCELCRRKRRRCEYLPEALLDIFDPPEQESSVETTFDAVTTKFPAAFFLDTWLFRNRKLSVPDINIVLPTEFLEVSRAKDETEPFLGELQWFFRNMHPCLPIVSKIRAYQRCATETLDKPDIVFFKLVIRLLRSTVCTPSGGQGNDASDIFTQYRVAKRLYSHLEACGVISLTTLQALLLLGYWEIGHAVYPAAFVTIGICARLGYALGIHQERNVPPIHFGSGSYIDLEECRRTWWGTLVLDRYITMGLVKRPFSCEDARPDAILPMVDRFWDQGEPCVAPSLAVSMQESVPASTFARTCQASHLLTRVLRHINEPPEDLHFWYREGLTLHNVLESFATALSLEGREVIGGSVEDDDGIDNVEAPRLLVIGLTHSAQMLLYDTHSCSDLDHVSGVGIPEQLELQGFSLQGLKATCRAVSRFAARVREALGSGTVVSPLLTSCMYEAGKYYFWYYKETGRAELLKEVEEIMQTLGSISTTWGLAREYLSILDGEEFRP